MDHVVAALAASQHGLITRAQALAAGMTDRQVRYRLSKGLWVRLRRGVYRTAGAPASWQQRVLAACLATGAVASHRTAAALWKLDGFAPGRVELTAPVDGCRRAGGVTLHRTRTLQPVDVTERETIPVTTASRTLIDLAAVVDSDSLEEALESALRQQLTSYGYLLRRLDAIGGHGCSGTGTLRQLIERGRGSRPSESVRELRLARLLVQRGLPEPVRQFELRVGGCVAARFDLAYPRARVAIEFQSYQHHFGRRAWRRDEVRRRRATSQGWLVFEATEDDVADGAAALAADVAPLLWHRTDT